MYLVQLYLRNNLLDEINILHCFFISVNMLYMDMFVYNFGHGSGIITCRGLGKHEHYTATF